MPNGRYIGHQETKLVKRKITANAPKTTARVPLIRPVN